MMDNIFQLSMMDDWIDSLGDTVALWKLDDNLGYWKIPVQTEDRDKTFFTTHMGTYR